MAEVAFTPSVRWEVGFQLSFLATLAWIEIEADGMQIRVESERKFAFQ